MEHTLRFKLRCMGAWRMPRLDPFAMCYESSSCLGCLFMDVDMGGTTHGRGVAVAVSYSVARWQLVADFSSRSNCWMSHASREARTLSVSARPRPAPGLGDSPGLAGRGLRLACIPLAGVFHAIASDHGPHPGWTLG